MRGLSKPIVVLYCLSLFFQCAAQAETASRGDEPPQLILEFIDDVQSPAVSGADPLALPDDLSSAADAKHQLRVEEQEIVLEDTKLSAEAAELINSISDKNTKQELISRAFAASSQKQQDAAQLIAVANAALSLGLKDQALSAYRKAIELNPNSLDAHHALASTTSDSNERARSYLKSVSSAALTSIADTWFEASQANASTIAAAMIPYQFAILKEPANAELRYRFARKLERAGLSYYALAAKRYLEAAVLAKQKFLAGDKTVENMLRDSVESLIRTLAIQGDFDGAAKYCHSYISLGYERFSAGDSVRGILRKMQARRNPFRIIEESRA